MRTITLQREGVFSVQHTGSNANQCGALRTSILNYRVAITADDIVLSPQGFLVDNNRIHDYFVDTYRDIDEFVSCERIAMKARDDMLAAFQEDEDLRKVRILSIEVAVSGTPGAWLTARWAR
jgi:hypothetical protein